LEWVVEENGHATEAMKARELGYYPWPQSQLFAALRALNIWIGRFRAHGIPALYGPWIAWGDFDEFGVDMLAGRHDSSTALSPFSEDDSSVDTVSRGILSELDRAYGRSHAGHDTNDEGNGFQQTQWSKGKKTT
jgi:hypothetical protein